MTIKITGDHVFYALVFVAAVLVAAYMNGHTGNSIQPPTPPDQNKLSDLSQEDCDTVRYVIDLTLSGVDDGTIRSVTVALKNIRSELPDDIQDLVMDSLPKLTWDSLRDQLTSFESTLPHQ